MIPVERRSLDGGWRLRLATAADGAPPDLVDRIVPATVPGCVHTDLLDAGLIPDPYLDDNESALRWIGESDWEYVTSFGWDENQAERIDLVFDGLDTVATITVNGVEVGDTANMHRRYRFDVRGHLRPGDNELMVAFSAPLTHVARLATEMDPLPHGNVYPEPFNLIRKMACNFGWDWGPQLTTAGIWRSVGLESWTGVRMAAVRPHVTVAGDVGRLVLDIDLEWAGPSPGAVTVTAAIADISATVPVPAGAETTGLVVEVPAVEWWWPHGHGDQPLYDLEVTLRVEPSAEEPSGAAEKAMDAWHRRIAFRSVRIDTSPDSVGSKWQLVVNDKPIWVRGANWIPDDCFPSRIDRDRLRRRIEQAAAANIDLLRVWGGGIYESDDFYELCDERGVMVWQDFLFACAAYAETPKMITEVAIEAEDNITRLMPHPSLVLWNGNNENQWGYEDWGWQEELEGRPWGAGYYHELLPALVAKLDRARPYWPGSPYSAPGVHPNDPHHGNTHIWDVWNEKDYTEYRSQIPRFVSEFGFQGPPTFATLRRAISDDPLTPTSPGMAHHQKARNGNANLHRWLGAHFPEPTTVADWPFDDWHYLAQVNQARAISLGIEHFRANRAVCAGSIVWQLNDCWPVSSWAAIDGDGRLKPLWYALRRAYADRLLTVQPDGDELRVVAVNDSAKPWSGTAVARRVDVDGEVLAEEQTEIEILPGSSEPWLMGRSVSTPGDPTRELITVTLGKQRAWWFWVRDRDFGYPAADLRCSVTKSAEATRVTVTAETLVRDLCLFADRLDPDATLDDMLVTLLPGESHVFEVTGSGLDAAALTIPPALRCVNDIPGFPGRLPAAIPGLYPTGHRDPGEDRLG